MGPCYSITARGQFGIYVSAGVKRAPYPYPIGIRVSGGGYSHYHPYGWYYQLRRTWHGVIWAAHRYTPPTNPRSALQQGYRGMFADGVSNWHNLTDEEKTNYNQLKFPRRMTGFNRFMHYFLREHLSEGYPVGKFFLMESGDKILQEDDNYIALE